VLTSVPAFLNQSYFCHTCNKAYCHQHNCPTNCHCCLQKGVCQKEDWIHCGDCNKWFVSQTCFNKHKADFVEKGNKRVKVDPVCSYHKLCTTCGVYKNLKTKKGKNHVCYKILCQNCMSLVDPETHQCFIQGLSKEEKFDKSFIFYDFEACQESELPPDKNGRVFLHEPICCVVQKVCDKCAANWTPTSKCDACKDHQLIFEGDNCLADFCKWLFGSPENYNCIAIGHNMKGYDGQFILAYLESQAVVPDVTMRGLEILCLQAAGVKLIDSFNFLPMALSALPKAFGEQEEKGTFPYLFIRKENLDYVGPLPDSHYYNPDSMKAAKRDEFLQWYEQEKVKVGDTWNFREEMLKYCVMDVQILRQCSMKFRSLFLQVTDMDPFKKSLTIASVCMKVFQTNFLEPDTIGLVPEKGYRRKERQSITALKWLKWLSESQGIHIAHARNGGEQRFGNFKADGWCEASKTVYEFYGCVFHGCPSCFPDRNKMVPGSNKTMGEVYQHTVDREQYMLFRGFNLVTKWECELRRDLRMDFEMKDYFSKTKIVDPLDARTAFFGGRTNAIKLHHRCEPGEEIHYLDVTSLYPSRLKYEKFPIGHAEVLTENLETPTATNQPYFGLISCRILPPKSLYHPVLPYRSLGKLTFPLCAKCTDTRNYGDCNHSDEQRAWDGAWVTPEIYKALKSGYKILKMYEVWHYPRSMVHNPKQPDSGLFTGYVNTFLKVKQEADGWPSWCKSEEDKLKYIRDYEDKEGIKLDPSKIERNEGLRSLAKLLLNCFWGKFGQRSNLTKTEYHDDPGPYFATVFDPENVIHSAKVINENRVMIQYVKEDEFIDMVPNTSTVLASFTTGYARLELYRYLEQLDRRVLYFDTDSVIFTWRPGQWKPPLGSFLGDMTCELSKPYGPGSYIVEFTAGGPKNYGYIVKSTNDGQEHTSLKVRGFSLNYGVAKDINYGALRRMVKAFVLSGGKEIVTVKEQRIRREKNRQVVTKTVKKDYRVVYDKRKLLPDFTTLPFGYC